MWSFWGTVVAVIQCLQYYYYSILQSYFENYLVSQHSTEAPLDHVSTLYSTDGASDTFVDYQILNVKRQKNGFPQVLIIFYYYNDLKVFINFIAFKCLCHNYVCTCSGSCT